MAEIGLPVLYALFVWWFSTGAILYLDGLPRVTHRWTLFGATLAGLAALAGLVWIRQDTSMHGAYAGFTAGLLIWAWHEVSFLTGFVTGPRTTPCQAGCRGWRHFLHASEAILYHELAILATALLLAALTLGAPNQIGLWTFLVLWLMRISAKLNVFFGVPNLSEEFLPEHLDYLKSFFNKRQMNGFFPLAVSAATVVTTLLVLRALAPGAAPFEVTGLILLATLMALAILEHWFLVLPLPDAALWSWGLRSRATAKPAHRLLDQDDPHLFGGAPAMPAGVRPCPATPTQRRRSA